MSTDAGLYQAECSALVVVAGMLALVLLHRRLARGRDLAGVLPLALGAFVVRAVIVVGVSNAGSIGRTIRGTDDPAFFYSAQLLAGRPWGSRDWLSTLAGDGLTLVSGGVIKLMGDPGPDSLRLVQSAIAAVAVLVLMVAVHDLAGRCAALLTGAILLVEPSSLFFTTILQKESLLLLAVALGVFATAGLWRGRLLPAAGAAVGALVVAGSVRPYAAGFLAVGLVVCGLHWALGHAGPHRGRAVAALMVCAIGGTALFIGTGTAGRALSRLQEFQTIETGGTAALRLAPVNFTTIGGLAMAVPERLLDFAVRPLPWQLASDEQRLGAFGTVVAWSLVLWTGVGFVLSRRARAALPLLYVAATVTVGYAITSANAGTGFRHRLHVLFLLAGMGSALWVGTPAGRRVAASLSGLWKRRAAGAQASLGARTARSGTSVAVRYAAVGILNLAGSVYLIRKLGPEIWATYTVAFFIAAFFDQQVGTKVLGSIVGGKKDPTRSQIGATALVSLAAGVAILAGLLVLRGPLSEATKLPGLAGCLAAAGGCAVVLAVRAPAAAVLERGLRFHWIAVAEVLDQVTFFAVAIPVALSGRPTTGLALGLLVRGVPGAAVLLAVGRPRMFRPSRADIRVATAFGAPVLVVAALALVEGLVPFAVLGPVNPRALGWVNTAASLVGYAAVVMLVMQRVSFAALSDLRRRQGKMTEQIRSVAESATLLLLVMVTPTALAEHWAPVLFGDSWQGAGATFAAIGIGYLLMGPITVAFGALYANGTPSRVMACYVAMTSIYGGLVISGALQMTATGVAVAYALSRLGGLFVVTALIRSAVAPSALAFAVAAGAGGGGGLALVAWWADGGPALAAAFGSALAAAAAGALAVRQSRWLWRQARSVLPAAPPEPELGLPLAPEVRPRA